MDEANNRFKVKIDSASWDKGFQDGKEGKPDRSPADMDGYSYQSGYIEGKAERLKRNDVE